MPTPPKEKWHQQGRQIKNKILYPRHLKMRAYGKRVKALSIERLCDWPEREHPTPRSFKATDISFQCIYIPRLLRLRACGKRVKPLSIETL